MKKKQIATTKWKPATWDTNGPIVYSGSPDGSDPTCDKTNYYPIIGHCNPNPLENPPTCGECCSIYNNPSCAIGPSESSKCKENKCNTYTIPCLSTSDYKTMNSISCSGKSTAVFDKGTYPAFMDGGYKDVDWEDIKCMPKHYNTTVADFNNYAGQWYARYLKLKSKTTGFSLLTITDPDDPTKKKTIKAAMSIGHGLFNSSCGGFHLIRFKTVNLDEYKYIINFQVGMRTWSFETKCFDWVCYNQDPKEKIIPSDYCQVFEAIQYEWNDPKQPDDITRILADPRNN